MMNHFMTPLSCFPAYAPILTKKKENISISMSVFIDRQTILPTHRHASFKVGFMEVVSDSCSELRAWKDSTEETWSRS